MRENAYISIQSTSLHTPHAVVYIKSPKKPKYTKENKLLFESLQNHGELDSSKKRTPLLLILILIFISILIFIIQNFDFDFYFNFYFSFNIDFILLFC